MEEELKKKDEKIATLLTKVETLRAARAEEIARLSRRSAERRIVGERWMHEVPLQPILLAGCRSLGRWR